MTAANTLQKTYVQTLQASFATGTLPAHCRKERKEVINIEPPHFSNEWNEVP
jgi:hypothetical protein